MRPNFFSWMFLLSVVSAQIRGSAPCHDVHILLSRGTDEDYPGWLGELVNGVCGPILEREAPGITCGYQDIIYPATFGNYCDSVVQGGAYGKTVLTEYTERCPDSKIVLAGWSQGAQVLGDILAGGAGKMPIVDCVLPKSLPIASDGPVAKQIKAITFFGDTRHVGGEVYNAGTGSSFDSVAPRTSEMKANLDKYTDVIQSYCNLGDPYCAKLSQPDPNNHTAHEPDAYREKHLEGAVSFIRRQIAMDIKT